MISFFSITIIPLQRPKPHMPKFNPWGWTLKIKIKMLLNLSSSRHHDHPLRDGHTFLFGPAFLISIMSLRLMYCCVKLCHQLIFYYTSTEADVFLPSLLFVKILFCDHFFYYSNEFITSRYWSKHSDLPGGWSLQVCLCVNSETETKNYLRKVLTSNIQWQ